jgi:hypothetical protein
LVVDAVVESLADDSLTSFVADFGGPHEGRILGLRSRISDRS